MLYFLISYPAYRYCLFNKVPSDFTLIRNGKFSHEGASNHMAILDRIRTKNEKNRPLLGCKLGLSLHVTKETSVLVMTAKRLGAEIALCSANPLSAQEDIAAFLSSEGVITFVWKGGTIKEYKECIRQVLKFQPHNPTDDCAELHIAAHKSKIKNIHGRTEETTSGVKRLKSIESKRGLMYPIIAVNDSNTKHMFDNRYRTGQSTIDRILRTTGLFLAGNNIWDICFVLCLPLIILILIHPFTLR
jgi:adenosylhomocysteinase